MFIVEGAENLVPLEMRVLAFKLVRELLRTWPSMPASTRPASWCSESSQLGIEVSMKAAGSSGGGPTRRYRARLRAVGASATACAKPAGGSRSSAGRGRGTARGDGVAVAWRQRASDALHSERNLSPANLVLRHGPSSTMRPSRMRISRPACAATRARG